jgi:hypothetical protein
VIEQDTAASTSDELSRAVAQIKLRGVTIPIDRWLMLVGGGLIAIGVPLIFLGWFGAARTPYVFEQIPYLISGGLLGLALCLLGGLFYFAYWMTRQVQETRRAADRAEAAFMRLEQALSGNGSVANGATVPERATKGASSPNGSTFVATSKGTMFHRAECTVVQGRSDVRKVKGSEPGLKPCGICDPLGVNA